MALILYAAVAFTLFCVIALLLTPVLLQPSPAEKRLMALVQSSRPDERPVGSKERLKGQLLDLARAFRNKLGLSEDVTMKQRLMNAGLSGNSTNLYFAARCIAPLAGIVLGSLRRDNTFFFVLVGGAVGYLAPDMWLRFRTRRRRERMRKGIPDAIDLLVICVEAGLGIDQALLRVGQELSLSYPEINHEFMQLNIEQRAGKPRLEAWESMAQRTQLPDFASFVNMLSQTERFGTPIIKALTRLSDDIRLKRRQHAEEMAAKVKIKILFPLVIFIFPCIFIVLLAPALISLSKTFGSLGK